VKYYRSGHRVVDDNTMERYLQLLKKIEDGCG